MTKPNDGCCFSTRIIFPVAAVWICLFSFSAPAEVTVPEISYSSTIGFKPRYYEDAGRNLEQTLALASAVNEHLRLQLSGGLVAIDEPQQVVYPKDILAGLAFGGVALAPDLSLQTALTVHLPLRLPHKEQELRTKITPSAGVSQGLGPFTLGYRFVYGKYFYKTTLNADGIANPDHDLSQRASLAAALAPQLTLATGFALITRTDYNGRSKNLYATDLNLAFAITPALEVAAGIATSTAQIKNHAVDKPKLFAKDLTEGFLGFTYGI